MGDRQMTRASTPKYEVQNQTGVVAISGVSKTEAKKIAAQMNKNIVKNYSKVRVLPVKRSRLPY